MSKCISCGRKGLFFFVDLSGLCKDCAERERMRKQEDADDGDIVTKF